MINIIIILIRNIIINTQYDVNNNNNLICYNKIFTFLKNILENSIN